MCSTEEPLRTPVSVWVVRIQFFSIEWSRQELNEQQQQKTTQRLALRVCLCLLGWWLLCVCASAFSYSFIFWSVSVVMDFPLSKRNDLCVSHSQYITARTMWTKESKWNKKHTHRMNIWKNRSYFKCHKWMDGANRIAQTVYSVQECIGES